MQILEAQQGVGVSPVQEWHHQDGWGMQSHYVSVFLEPEQAEESPLWWTVSPAHLPFPAYNPLSPYPMPKWPECQMKHRDLILDAVFRLCCLAITLEASRGNSTESFLRL